MAPRNSRGKAKGERKKKDEKGIDLFSNRTLFNLYNKSIMKTLWSPFYQSQANVSNVLIDDLCSSPCCC
jgi:hypothetical protein